MDVFFFFLHCSFKLQDVMQGAEDCVKFLSQWIMDNCMEDMKILSKAVDKDNISRPQLVTSSSMENVSYTEAIDILQKVVFNFRLN